MLLGASNLTRAFSTVVGLLESAQQGPLEILAAMGRGRSYGMPSRMLGRELPGIVDCGLWDRLSTTPLPTWALVTDVGNDVLYGAEVDAIVGYVATCLDRLASVGAEIVVTGLPIERLQRLGPLPFYLFRTILFPSSRLSHDQALRRAQQLDDALQSLAARRSARFVAPRASCYGLDPIHIRRREWSGAWRRFLEQWPSSAGKIGPVRASLPRWWALQRAAPCDVRWFGVARRHAQPSQHLRGGSTISLY